MGQKGIKKDDATVQYATVRRGLTACPPMMPIKHTEI
jgi:hypothetical protein